MASPQLPDVGGLKLSCSKCRYVLTVTTGLMPWAEGVMRRHLENKHGLVVSEEQDID